jgi:hypothetical protein
MEIVGVPPFRGDDFAITFELGGTWLGTDFEEVLFTVRAKVPESTVVDDDDALGQVVPTFVGNVGTAAFTGAMSTSWPSGKLHWDVQGKYDGGKRKTLQSGTFTLQGDITRS